MRRPVRSTLFRAVLVAASFAATAPVVAKDAPGDRLAGPVAASVLKVRDGDTLEVEAYVWPSQVVRTAVRLRGIDAPELRARCDAERKAAELARDRLTALVAGGGPVQLADVAGDKYFGRVLARVSANGVADIGARLLDEGLVAPYAGEKRRDWCAGAPTLSTFRPSE